MNLNGCAVLHDSIIIAAAFAITTLAAATPATIAFATAMPASVASVA